MGVVLLQQTQWRTQQDYEVAVNFDIPYGYH